MAREIVHQGGNEINGLEEFNKIYGTHRSAFHDTKIVIEQLIAEGDFVMSRCRLLGQHKGQLGHMSATENNLNAKGYTVFRIKDGKIVEEWELIDELAIMTQLGLELGLYSTLQFC